MLKYYDWRSMQVFRNIKKNMLYQNLEEIHSNRHTSGYIAMKSYILFKCIKEEVIIINWNKRNKSKDVRSVKCLSVHRLVDLFGQQLQVQITGTIEEWIVNVYESLCLEWAPVCVPKWLSEHSQLCRSTITDYIERSYNI